MDVGAHLDLVASLELGRGGDPGGARDGALGRGDADAPACRKRGKGGRHGQWSRRAGNTCPTVTRGRLSGAPRRWIGAPATWVSDGPASARIRTGEDGRCGGECGHFTCDVRTNGVRARRVVAPRHARSYPLTGHADCVCHRAAHPRVREDLDSHSQKTNARVSHHRSHSRHAPSVRMGNKNTQCAELFSGKPDAPDDTPEPVKDAEVIESPSKQAMKPATTNSVSGLVC